MAVGPGLGTGERPRRLLDGLLAAWSGPLVLDADALTLLAGRLDVLAGAHGAHPADAAPG